MMNWDGMIVSIDTATKTAVSKMREAQKSGKAGVILAGAVVAIGVILFLRGK